MDDLAPALQSPAILGETGSGKDFIAQAYHSLTRRPGPFIAVNCAALRPGAFFMVIVSVPSKLWPSPTIIV